MALKKYENFIAQKSKTYQDTRAGWVEHKDWVEALFDLDPPSPNCDIVDNFRDLYNISKGTLVLSKNEKLNAAYSLTSPTENLLGRNVMIKKMWDDVNSLWNLPPNAKFVLYMNDKPRILKDIRLPAFTIAAEFRAGSGMPKQWKGHVPFPSHFYSFKPKDTDLPLFESKRPVVFFCGRFSGL